MGDLVVYYKGRVAVDPRPPPAAYWFLNPHGSARSMKTSRREFLKNAATFTAAFSGLASYANGKTPSTTGGSPLGRFGKLKPDPNRIFDLPEGFSYKIIGRAGDLMEDGLRIPGHCDGMGAFEGPDGKTILIRNHELEIEKTFEGPFGLQNELFGNIDRSMVYDAGQGMAPHIGGTTTVVFNTQTQEVERQFLSLAGTCRNCAGGKTPWGSWITCEETVDKKGTSSEPEQLQRAGSRLRLRCAGEC